VQRLHFRSLRISRGRGRYLARCPAAREKAPHPAAEVGGRLVGPDPKASHAPPYGLADFSFFPTDEKMGDERRLFLNAKGVNRANTFLIPHAPTNFFKKMLARPTPLPRRHQPS
jgi:hypothetical protein